MPALAVLVSVAFGLWLLPVGFLHAQTPEIIEYAEHTPVASPVATFTATDDEDDKAGKALTWSVEGTDAGYFDISQRGVLTFKESPDYENAKGRGSGESANTYTVDVVATDSASGKGTHSVVVKVTNEDEPGTLTLSNRQPVVGVALTATLTDVDGGVSNEQWQWARSSNRGGPFVTIEATETNGAGTVAYVPDSTDTGRYLRVTVTYTDAEGPGKQESVVSDRSVLARRAANAAPVIIDSDGSPITATSIDRDVAENSPAGTPVGDSIGVSNPERDVLTYTLSGDDAGKFTIDSSGQIRVGPGTELDTEGTATFSVTVTVSDGNLAGLANLATYSDSVGVAIGVTDVPEPPELSGKTSVSHPENTSIETPVAAYKVTDDEDDFAETAVGVTLSGADASAFTLTDSSSAGGTADDGTWELAFKSMPDFESPVDAGRNNTYNVTVRATDSAGRTDVLNIAVVVTNVDEEGTVSLSTLAPKVGVELTATLTGDLDGRPSRVTWKWERADSGAFGDSDSVTVISGATSASYTPVHADAGKYLRATALYADPQGPGKSAGVVSAGAVAASNKPPWFDDPSTGDKDESIKEIAQEEGEFQAETDLGDSVSATDPENAQLTYELSGDAALFIIDRSTGQIKVRAGTTLDYETKSSYVVRVKATDPDGASATATVTINITDVPEPPVISGTGSFSFLEHTPINRPVATFRATDDEDDKARKALTWSVEGTDAGYFVISQRGVLTFKESPDYENAKGEGSDESANTYDVDVVATDSASGEGTHSVVVKVTNDDEPGTLTLSNRQPVVGVGLTATLIDVDGRISNQQWKWAWGTSRAGRFTDMDSTDLPTYAPVEVDGRRYLRVTVTYTDGQGSGKTKSAVSERPVRAAKDSDTTPVFVDDRGTEITDGSITREVRENSRAGTLVGGRVRARDPEGDVLTFALDGDDAGKFTIDSNGQIKVGPGTELDAEEDSLDVTVTVTDGVKNTTSINVTITVTDVPESPELSGKTSVSHPENTSIETPVAAYKVTDDEDDFAETAVGVTLSGADASAFTLTDSSSAGGTADDGTWELAFKSMPDFESPVDAGRNNTYNVTVRATDSAGRTDVLNIAVVVTNVDEEGTVSLSTLAPKVGVELTATLTGDLDGRPSRVTWKWERADSGAFGDSDSVTVISGATSASYTPVHADAGKYLRATALYADPQGPGKSAGVVSAGAVAASNKPPWFDDPSTGDKDESIKEIAQEEGEFQAETDLGDSVSATDPENAQLTYELSGDAALFDIDRSTGQIKVRAGTTLDYETKSSYVVRVKATDPDGASATATVTINITDVPEPPVIRRGGLAVVGPGSLRYAENGSGPVATYRPAGPKAATARWGSLSGADAGKFSISTGGVLTFKAPPDYEAQGSADGDNVYHVVVTANDGENDPAVRHVTVTVTDVDETSTGDPLLDRWDANRNGKIDRSEVTRAINAYFDGGLQAGDRAVVIQLMERYFQDAQS